MGDPLTLYPLWRIRLYLDKLYPGNVYGIYVMLWADTGEIYKVQEMMLMGSFSSGSEDIPELANEGSLKNINKYTWALTLLLIGTMIVTAVTTVICRRRKASTLKLNDRALRCGVILFLLASFTLTAHLVIEDVKADFRGSCFMVPRWNTTLSEQQAAQAVIEHMTYNFQQRDYEVYPKTGGKHYFVTIWVCHQGDYIGGWGPLGAYGIPHAWHHTTNLPSDGPYCFIGFEDERLCL